MANTMTGKPVRSAWAGVLAGIALMMLLAPVAVTTAQQPDETVPPPRAPRARVLLKSAIDNYKVGDYELAAKAFAQVQANQNELSVIERTDFKNFAQRNSDALAAQREGSTQVRQVQEYLSAGKNADAARLLKRLQANQYLSAADRMTLASLHDNGRGAGQPGKGVEAAVPNNEKALIAAAREALKRKEYDLAAAYTEAAEKVQPFMHFPGSDTPAKVRADIVRARAKDASSAGQMANGITPDKKESVGPFTQVKKMFIKGDDKKDGPMPPDGPSMIRGPDLPPPAPIGSMGNKQPEGPLGPLVTGPTDSRPDLRQAVYPPVNESGPPGAGSANRNMARKLIKEGYEALKNNDLDTARRKALQAKELRPDLEWWEENPGRLLEDIQRRASKGSGPGANAGGKPMAPGDARILIKEARTLLMRDKIDEADKLCSQAATAQPKTWGLFEDSPDKLRADIQKARSKRDRDESARLMVEARKLFAAGKVQEARLKAESAQKLHGPYNVWDVGERPQKLLEEIQRAEGKSGSEPLSGAEAAKAAALKNGGGDFQNNRPGMAPPLVSGTAQAAAKIRAAALLQQARALQKQGNLIEAHGKAMEADQLRVTFGPEEDSPAAVLVSLAAQCERTVDQLLQRASERIQNHPTDANRFKNAAEDINAARLMARTFRLDSMRIEQKAQWLQQAAASSGQPLIAARTPGGAQAGGPSLPPPLPDSPAGKNRLLGLEKLDKARLELTAGNLAMARRLAEDAFNPVYGIQEEAGLVLRSIDADEYNHNVNMANRNADAGIDAYQRGEFRQAAGIFNSIDMRLVQADKARRIGEYMSGPGMQPATLQLVGAKELVPAANSSTKPGSATATDLPGDDLTQNYRAMEEIQFQQMRDRGMNVQRTAMELFKA
ncbi:MAG TPA: hypothetical protein VNX28_10720, partial [Gemmataceae bacterium]|nr:hypothetical protein [Gemmataceae bacterium]